MHSLYTLLMPNHVTITPVSVAQQAQIVDATNLCVSKAQTVFGRSFEPVPVFFDLNGKCAGMYQVRGQQRRIRYNPWIFAKFFQDSLNNTVTHEVCHYIVDRIWGLAKVKPHGAEWRKTMRAMGAEPLVTGNYDLSGIPVRQYTKYSYQCNCSTHQLTALRHRKIVQNGVRYRCQQCHGFLQQVPE
jgi:SprT protein